MQVQVQSQGYLYTFSSKGFEKTESGVCESSALRKIKENNGLIRVLIADDHPYLVHGVETDLNKDLKIKIVGTASEYDELICKVSELQPDVVLLDLKMPGRDKHDLKHYMTGLKAIGNCRIIIFSNETGWARMHRCLEIGAQAYVEKALALGRLSEFIHRVYENDELLIFTQEKLPHIYFTERQKEVLHYLADGKENDEIAVALNLELKTIQFYVCEMKLKLSQAFDIHPLKNRTFYLLASKLGFGHKIK